MAEIQPFRAYRYDTNRFALKDVLTQPYDKITPAMQGKYYAAGPYNLIPVEKGRSFPDDSPANNVYSRASQKIEEWIAEKALLRDAAPNIYVYSEEFEIPGTKARRTRTGFIALARIEDYDANVIFRHERTLSGPKADRIELLQKTRVQTGQLFLLYDDPANRVDNWMEGVMKAAPAVEMIDEYGVVHRVWPVSDSSFISRVQQAMANRKLVIADGHHRYETALFYRNQAREKALDGGEKVDPFAATEFAMATFINTQSKGLTILPTHRVVSNVPNFTFEGFRRAVGNAFDWYAYPFANAEERSSAYAEFRRDLEKHPQGRRAVGVYPAAAESQRAFYLFAVKKGIDLADLLPDVSEGQHGLDVVLLHRLMLEEGLGITADAVAGEKNLSYEREMDKAIAAVDTGAAQMAMLLNPVGVQQVMAIALGGGVMPQKSTDFYPKLLSGLAIYRVEGAIR